MPVESDDDRLALLADFGVEVTIGARTVVAIFDNGFEDGNGQWITVPVLTAREIDFEDNDKGDLLSIAGVDYTIAEEPQTDGQGMANILLQKV